MSDLVHGPISASRMAWVPHSANPTSLACGNAAYLPRLNAGRPKKSTFAGVSARSRISPSIATSLRPANQEPRVSGPANGITTLVNRSCTGSTEPGTRLEDRRLRRRRPRLGPTRRPRQRIRQLSELVRTRTLRLQRHCDRAVRHHPSRRRPIPLLGAPGITKHLIHDLCRKDPRQQTPATKSENRRSETGFTHPERGTPQTTQ